MGAPTQKLNGLPFHLSLQKVVHTLALPPFPFLSFPSLPDFSSLFLFGQNESLDPGSSRLVLLVVVLLLLVVVLLLLRVLSLLLLLVLNLISFFAKSCF